MLRHSTPRLAWLYEPHAWRHWRPWAGTFAVWTLVGIFTAQQRYQAVALRGYELPWYDTLSTSLSHAWMWVPFTFVIFWVVYHYPLERGQLARSAPVHVAVAAALFLLNALLEAALGRWVEPYPAQPVAERFSDELAMNGASYVAVLAVAQAFRYYALYRDREAEADELRAELTLAHLESLKAQLQPHFLFNTLNAIAETVYQDPDRANQLITDLSALLRRSVEASAGNEVPLRTELEFLTAYLDIVRARFGDRLDIRTAIDPATLDVMVPPFLLQPLAENALRHGIERTEGPGVVEIAATRDEGRVVLIVQDNGPGVAPLREHPPGVGLRNTRHRLQNMYGQGQTFAIVNRPEGGTAVTVTLPFRTVEPPVEVLGA